MDEIYERSSYHSHEGYQRQQHPRYRRPESSSNRPVKALKSKTSNFSYLNGQNFGILMAFLVIYLFHRKEFGIGRLLEPVRRERGIWNTLIDWFLEIQEYVTAYGQMCMEVLRNLRCHLLAHGDEWIHDLSMPTSPMSPSSLNASSGARGRRRNVVAPAGGRMAASRMPELEETDVNKQKNGEMDAYDRGYYIFDKENTDPLEPAFLKDEDYPPGWLVFDPVLGVVSKAEADKFRREQTQKKGQLLPAQQQQQQQQQQPPQPNNQHADQALQPTKQQSAATQQHKMNPNNSTTPSRRLRTNNVMPNASPMHTPHTIAANG